MKNTRDVKARGTLNQFVVHQATAEADMDLGSHPSQAPVRLWKKYRPGGATYAQNNSGRESKMEVHLDRFMKLNGHLSLGWLRNLVPDPSYSHVYYDIKGQGVDTYPTGVFHLDSDTGDLFLLKAVAHEDFPEYNIVARVFDKDTNVEIGQFPLKVIVDDVNDNAPEFAGSSHFTVPEHCSAGTVVGVVIPTDRDDFYTDHAKIKYTLLSGSDMFTIHPETGVITTTTNTLDRELKENHVVTVKIQDMNGAPNGRFATVTIALSDINDNPPTFMKSSYNVTVQENESEKLLPILEIPVQDKDLKKTLNWKSKFVITNGNENGNFRIVTDPQTNKGLLYISKPLDYEKTNNVQLQITAQNAALLNGSNATWQSIPVNVNVERGNAGSVSFGLLGIMAMLCPAVLVLLLFAVLVLVNFCQKRRRNRRSKKKKEENHLNPTQRPAWEE